MSAKRHFGRSRACTRVPLRAPPWVLRSMCEDAASEDRTHDLTITRPTRCQLRHRRVCLMQILIFKFMDRSRHRGPFGFISVPIQEVAAHATEQ